jgi:sterol desaturase/sphingolipid hydroxylase (fatty acid hydroxylase superfamily)
MSSTQINLAWETAVAALTHADWREMILFALSPVFALALGLEWWRATRQPAMAPRRSDARPVYGGADTQTSIALGGTYNLIELAWLSLLIWPAMDAVAKVGLPRLDMTLTGFVLLYVAVDALYYAFHRASHRIRWFWCAHVVHHGSEHMNLSTAMRQSWLYAFAGHWLFYLPLVWIGVDPRWVWAALSLNLAYQFFVHTQMVDKLPAPIEWLFNTPSHHRAHHGRNPRYIDCNYGGTFIVFDRLFGSFVPETEAVDYGLVHPVHSANPLWLTVQEWVAMARDVARPGPWTERLKHLWAPPEWQRPPTRPRSRDNPAHASQRPV